MTLPGENRMPDPDAQTGNPYAAPEAPITPADPRTDGPNALSVASLGWRLVAFVVDCASFYVICVGLFTLSMLLSGYGPPRVFGGRFMPPEVFGGRVTVPAFILIWVIHFAAQESSRWQATLGKRLFRLRVVGAGGGRVSFLRASARSLLKLFGVALFLLGLLPALFTRSRETLHDLLTETVVVRTRTNLLPPIQPA